MKYYILIYPNELVAKVYKNYDFVFKKLGEFDSESIDFIDTKCDFSFGFDAIFERFRD